MIQPGQTYTNGETSLTIHFIKDGQVYYCRWRGEWQEDYDWKMENAEAGRMKIGLFKKQIKGFK
jgi:hypothetical protein